MVWCVDIIVQICTVQSSPMYSAGLYNVGYKVRVYKARLASPTAS